MISGQMWVFIRKPPMFHGLLGLITPTRRYQVFAETYAVWFMYMAVTLGIIMINAACTEYTDD